MADQLEVFAADFRKIDLLDMHQAEQLTHGFRHVASAFVAGTAALGYANSAPEVVLIQSKLAADFARVTYSVGWFHNDVDGQLR